MKTKINKTVHESGEYLERVIFGKKLDELYKEQIEFILCDKNWDIKLKEFKNTKKKFPIHKKVPRPPHWSGWALKANEVEFWLDGNNRIHERLRYKKSGSKWVKEILYP